MRLRAAAEFLAVLAQELMGDYQGFAIFGQLICDRLLDRAIGG